MIVDDLIDAVPVDYYAWHPERGEPVHRSDSAAIRRDVLALGVQPGARLEPADNTLAGAAVRELTEETGIDPSTLRLMSATPVNIKYAEVPAHLHLDLGYAFTTTGDVGRLQEEEVTSACWYQLDEAERVVGSRIARALATPDL